MTRVATASTGVVLATFGSAVTADDVPAYLASVRGGRAVPDSLVEEFQRRYRLIGRSPLIDITTAQAAELQALLGEATHLVLPGMLHSDPHIGGALDTLADAGVRRILVLILSPQYSPVILAGYERAVAEWQSTHRELEVSIAGAWHTLPGWIDTLADRVESALARLPATDGGQMPIIFTAHSLPRAVVDRDPGYIDQLRETASALAARLRLDPDRWQFAYQSAGHTQEEWLSPDVADLLPGLRAAGATDVLVVPLQFLADHLEILYDIDIAAREEARLAGMSLHRIELPNTHPSFIQALATVVRQT